MVDVVGFVLRTLRINVSSLFSGRSEEVHVCRLCCSVQRALVKVRGSESLLLVDVINNCLVYAVNELWSNGICVFETESVSGDVCDGLMFLVRITPMYC
jgi:hypothetical protein